VVVVSVGFAELRDTLDILEVVYLGSVGSRDLLLHHRGTQDSLERAAEADIQGSRLDLVSLAIQVFQVKQDQLGRRVKADILGIHQP